MPEKVHKRTVNFGYKNMKIYSVYDKEFKEYGQVIDGDFAEILSILHRKDCPEKGTIYLPSDSELENTAISKEMAINQFGGMPIQVGYCNGHNKTLNCLEYHKDSEINVGDTDFILLLARRQDIKNGTLNTKTVKAFVVPTGVGVEIYSTSLHYAPCKKDGGFRVVIVLPSGTNTERPQEAKDKFLFAKNKWLLAHSDSVEARNGAQIGLIGENITI